jgi:NAD(P)-dependent dehydrogenase (short-subunit alcohol dehydrogenase family)
MTVYVVTGTNRNGIGRGLVTLLASRPDSIIYATCRDPAAAVELNTLASSGTPGKIIVVKLDQPEDYPALAAKVEKEAGVVDVVIANAALNDNVAPASKVSVESYTEHFQVNVGNVVLLYQVFDNLLAKSKVRKFVLISTLIASFAVGGAKMGKPVSAYGLTKTAANMFMIYLGVENEGLTAISIHPGVVYSDMLKSVLNSLGKEDPKTFGPDMITPAESAKGIMTVVDKATPEDNDKFYTYEDKVIPW